MRNTTMLSRAVSASVMAALIVGMPGTAFAGAARRPIHRAPHAGIGRPVGRGATVHRGAPPVSTFRPSGEVLLSIGQGELINLPASAADVWVSNDATADVYVSNPRQIHLFGKAFGEATLFATDATGAVIYATNVRVAQNITSIDRMIKLAMPDSNITVTTAGQIAVITGTITSPADSAQAERIVASLLNPGVDVTSPTAQLKIGVINRLRAATPLQVNLQVRIAEVSRSFVKNIGVNLATRDTTGGFQFGVASGRPTGTIGSVDTSTLPQLDASSRFGYPAGTLTLPFDPKIGDFVYPGTGTKYDFSNLAGAAHTALGFAGKAFGLDILSSLDLGETDGQVTTLANPNITAISGETGSFLAGGEIPIPIASGFGTVSVTYKQYGVSLAYTPTVLSDGRISLRVRPEVSQLSAQGAVTIGGLSIPAVTTRRAETTVELGSGQSMMIAGLLSNDHNNSISKAPGVGDLPVVGALFRSNAFQRNETELVIVVTPYLVKPVNANDIVLPTDGYKAPTDLNRVLLGQLGGGQTGGDRPKPSVAPSGAVQPSFGAAAPAPLTPAPFAPAPTPRRDAVVANPKKGAPVTPGFSIN